MTGQVCLLLQKDSLGLCPWAECPWVRPSFGLAFLSPGLTSVLSAPGGVGFVNDKQLCSPRSQVSPWDPKSCTVETYFLLPACLSLSIAGSACSNPSDDSLLLGLAT